MPIPQTSESVEALLHLFQRGFLIVRHAHAAPTPGLPDQERRLSDMGRVQCTQACSGHLGLDMDQLGLAYLACNVHRYRETMECIFGNNVPTRVDVPEFYFEHPSIPRGDEHKTMTDRLGYSTLARYYDEGYRRLLEGYSRVALNAFVREAQGQPHSKIGVIIASPVYGPQLALDLASGFNPSVLRDQLLIMGVNLPATGAILVRREGVQFLMPAE